MTTLFARLSAILFAAVPFAASGLIPSPVASANRSQVVQWIRENAVPLNTVQAGNGFRDLEPLQRVVGSARIVAIGEATHATRECFQLKHRIFEYLVTRMGFRVFALEANWTESLAINDYVLRGRGEPKHALAGLGFWTWYTEELVDLIVWMRQYNTDPRHPAKLKFVGFDMQRPAAAARAVQGYLAEVDPGTAREYRALLNSVANPRPFF